ncbi:ribosomal L28e protein family-domain-containing protein [Pisolithus albus]|nr:ribosomal L28e protein family-domain-containing protein [Pisolithus albus]
MQSDDVIWSVINSQFCSYKVNTATQKFCRNEYKVTGFCNRQSCPLANSRYEAVREKEGMLYLQVKATKRPHTPAKMWEMIQLSEDYSILGDGEEVEDEADKAGQVSSATEKSKEDPIEKAITIKLDDLSGNTFVKFLEAYRALVDVQDEYSTGREGTSEEMAEGDGKGAENTNEDIHKFMGMCSRCARPLIIPMKNDSVRYFQDTLILSINFGHCGYRDNSHSLVPRILRRERELPEDKGSRRFKQGYPENLAMQPGTLGGRSTIVEAFSELSYEELSEKEPSTLLLNDPLANLYLQNLYLRDPDLNMEIVAYERKWPRSEELGLNDMKVRYHHPSLRERIWPSFCVSVPRDTSAGFLYSARG